jgi:hypothetical protein
MYIKQVLEVLAKKISLKTIQMQFLYKRNRVSRLCYYTRENQPRPRKSSGDYYLGNTSYNKANIIFLRICELL